MAALSPAVALAIADGEASDRPSKDARFLEYTAEAIFDCALTYTFLKSHRLANCTFTFDEMVGEEASKLILDIVEGWRELKNMHWKSIYSSLLRQDEYCSRRVLLISLATYCVGSVAETSTLLLCEATTVVMEKCFLLLGIIPGYSISAQSLLLSLRSSTKRPMDVNAPEL
ncbi:hypothetical protein OROHE_018601 [Orobanche hederae]